LYKYSRILSDSSLDNSLIRFVNLMSTPSCPRNIRTIDKKSLPSRHRIGPNDRMNSSQIVPDGFAVLWRTAILGKRESQSLTRLKEVCSLMSGGQSLQPAPKRGGQTIVRFIRRGPQCITSCGRFCVDFQDCIVGGDFLECNICVPSIRCVRGTVIFLLVITITIISTFQRTGTNNWEVSITLISSPNSEV
jgi:hypothetical protein